MPAASAGASPQQNARKTRSVPISDPFATLVSDANTFFAELEANNAREWFEPRKEHYAKTIRQPAEHLCELVGEEITRLTGEPHSGKVYRIYRDVRFSKDKRPYNAHLHMAWSRRLTDDDNGLAPVWFFACSPTMLTVNMGVPRFEGDALTAWRDLVDLHGDELAEAIVQSGAGFSDWGEAPLKRMPAPYGAAHPHADLLKRRSLILDAPLGDAWQAEGQALSRAITARCAALLPVWRMLNTHLR